MSQQKQDFEPHDNEYHVGAMSIVHFYIFDSGKCTCS